MDALSAALGGIHIHSAIFYDVVCGAPWGFEVPGAGDAAPLLAPGAQRLVSYHLVAEGPAHVDFDDGQSHTAGPGHVVVLPRSDGHKVSNGRPARFEDSQVPLEEALSGRPSQVRLGGNGATTRIICGFFACSRLADHLFLDGLPRLLTVDLRTDEAGRWLEGSVRHLVAEARAQAPGSTAMLSKMAEVLFVDTLRRYLRRLPEDRRGWLAAARDPVVGAALSSIHRDPARPWTVEDLAAHVGTSRSVLGERFALYLDRSPLAYLAHWRLHLAARQLEATKRSVLEVALEVGYQSEAAFSRAFKRVFGLPPAAYRRHAQSRPQPGR